MMKTISNITKDYYNVYQGQIIDDKPNGYGIYQTNEYIYYGNFKDGLYDGIGKMIYIIASKTYKIDIKPNIIKNEDEKMKKNKFNKFKKFKNNTKTENKDLFTEDINDMNKELINEEIKEISYEGEFKNNLRDGNGKIIYSNGNIFIGLFKQNMKHGLGKEYNRDGKLLSSCEWIDDITNEKIIYIDYNDKGLKIVKGYMQNKKKVDLWKYYDDNENLTKIIYYTDDKDYTLDIIKKNVGPINYNFYSTESVINNITLQTLFIDDMINIYTKISNKINDDNYDDEFINLIINYGINNKVKYIISLKQINNIYELDMIKEYKNSNNDYIIKKIDNNIIFKYSLLDNNKLDEKYSLLDNKLIAEGIFNKNNKLQEGKIYENGFIKYEGIFNNEEDLINGKIYDNGIIKYDGKLQNNNYHDVNAKLYDNGILIYEGGFENHMKHGFGTLYHKDLMTLSYVGEWLNDMRHGQGSLHDELGELIITGQFDNNNLI